MTVIFFGAAGRQWGGGLAASTWLYFTYLAGTTIYAPFNNGRHPSNALIIEGWITTILLACFFIITCIYTIKKDFLCYTHYPIRLNRKNRKVYVFQHNGPAGILETDWEKVYWIIGKIKDAPRMTYDLRGHILDDDGLIRHTFSVGHCSKNWVETLQHWEMIRRYMEDSPADLPFPPLRLFVCTKPTLRNAFIYQAIAVDGFKSLPSLIFASSWAFFRWISQRTCRKPQWPADIEAACQIDDDDPYRQPEPWRMGEVLGMTEEDHQKGTEYTLQANATAAVHAQAHPEPRVSD
ncbi:hypothetical protein IFR09_15625 [Pseudomonas syringae]|nr:hypothetical protein [Pseudomonas syringae]MBD8804002.1 hypothetical protein [Pseudomonas syringae]MBD8812594.1 hypothetical protein [Pseudomonas syringae]